MNPDLKRRLKPFLTGASIGVVLSIMLLSFWNQSDSGPVSDQKEIVAVSKCELKTGDILIAACVDSREIESRFVPPGTLRSSSMYDHLGKKLMNDLPVGNAIREEDLN